MESKDNKIESIKTINCSGKLLTFDTCKVMGIINVNQDSFYPGSRVFKEADLLKKVEQFIDEGVDILDVGGISTRPHADLFNTQEELRRVVGAVESIAEKFPSLPLSIDTFRSDVAREAIYAGADIVNDVYGGSYDGKMFQTVAELNVPYILMHSRGDAQDMMYRNDYVNLVKDVVLELSIKLQELRRFGVKDVIIDPGFGFAKNGAQNFELLQGIDHLKVLDCPLLIGLSRKSMICKKLGIQSDQALNGTTVLNTFAYMKGANILRVHDVKEAREIIDLLEI